MVQVASEESSFDKQFDVFEEIGSGQFAVVKRCVEKATGRDFAAKFIRKRRIASSRRGVALEDIHREVYILRSAHHDNIVQLHDVFDIGSEIVLVLELIKGGELFEFVSQKEYLSEKETSGFIRQILLGLNHLHDMCVAHLDLKPENVLLVDRSGKHIKLIDFGLSRHISVDTEIRELMGTPEFVAPEIVNFEPVTLATDMWSVGVITYNLLSGISPFLGDSKQETFSNISAVDYYFDDENFSHVSELAKDFIAKLLVKDPRKRNTVDQCLIHPWIQQDNDLKKEDQLTSSTEKVFKVRQKWKLLFHLIMLCNRLSKGVKLKCQSSGPLQDVEVSYNQNIAYHYLHRDSWVLQDENFVVAALFSAIEEGNLAGLEELFAFSHFDPNQGNRHGETAVHIAAGLGQLEIVKFLHSHGADISLLDSHGDSAIYWAARQGHSEVIKYLFEQRVSVDTRNKAGETALLVAARYGHSDTLKLLCKFGTNCDIPDEHGETALHIAVWHGFPKIVFVLCEVGASPNLKNKEEETPLHCASARGHAESVRCLLEAGADLNLLDKNGCTPLHLAIRRHHIGVAMLLLQAGCQVDIVDHNGEAPIHIVAREGLLSLAQNLCAFGCQVDIPNQSGLCPLHLAAKSGHTEVVRCLCLAGCNVDQKNKDGIPAEITALAQGFTDIGELLNRLRNEQLREDYIAQLIPTAQPISRVKLKLFGHSGVGKTTLVDSLKCGYFSSFFRRSRASSPTPSDHRKSKNSCNSSTSSIELSVSTSNSVPLIFDTNMDCYTKGVDIQQLSIPGVGDLSVWEFSGHEPYFIVYDHFIGNTNCLHAIVFRMNDPPEVRYQQILFWLHFLQVRIPPIEPLSYCGRSNSSAKVVLIATHADVAGIYRNSSSGEYMNTEVTTMLQDLKKQFENILDLHDTVYITDAHVAGSPGMKHLKQYLSTEKVKVVQNLPKQTGFLDSMISHLPPWRKSSAVFPVLSWQQFVDMVHLQINPLAGEDHMKELITQLQLTGEVLYLKSQSQDLVVLNPRWLCVDVVGQLLSHDHLQQARVTGCYTVDDIQLLFPETDALDLLQVLEALHLCTQCESDGDIEYEFPIFNLVETLEGLWDENDLRYRNGVYGGVQIRPQAGMCHVIPGLFPRVQVQLRRSTHQHPDPENDLYQWHLGSKFCSGCLEGMITLSDQEAIEIKVRGPSCRKIDSFYFLEDLLCVVDQVLGDICPGLMVEKHFLSASQLQSHVDNPVSFPPDIVMKQLIKNGPDAVIERENVQEKVLDLFCSGATELQRYLNPDSGVSPGLTLAPDIHVSHLSVLIRQKLCAILDPPESMGRDWCMLGVRLGMTDELPHIDPGENSRNSPTARTLEQWSKNPNSTVKSLLSKLEELGREDAIQIILKCGPLFKVRPSEMETVAEDTVIVGAGSHTSSSNLSR